MTDVSAWSETADNNNSASPDGFPENMAPSGVNNSAREVMAAIATWFTEFDKGADIASATSLLVNIPGQFHDVTGTTTITSFATASGNTSNLKILQFDGVVTVTHHATNLILPQGANILTVAGDILVFYQYGAGTWVLVNMMNAGATRIFSASDAGATAGPTIDLHRDSASPADADLIGQVTFSGEDDGGNKTIYASIDAQIDDVTGGTEDGTLLVKTMTAGTLTTQIDISSALINVTPAVTSAGDITGTNFIATGGTSAGDAANVGYTAAGGLILTGQGSTSDVTIKNDADATVISIPTGTSQVGIGTTAPDGTLHVMSASAGAVTASGNANTLVLENSGEAGITIFSGTASSGNIYFGDANSNVVGKIEYNHSANSLLINTNGAEAARIDSAQTVHIGKTAVGIGVAGISQGGTVGAGRSQHTADGDSALQITRLTNDGALMEFFQAGSLEGSISVSGTTVSYNGAHLSFLSQLPIASPNRRDDSIKRGTVMEYCDEMCEWHYEDWEEEEIKPAIFEDEPTGLLGSKGEVLTRKTKAQDEEIIKHPKRLVVNGENGGTGKGVVTKKANEQRMRSCVSTTKGTKKVAGVFESWDDDNCYDNCKEHGNTWDYDFKVATTGDFIIRLTGSCEVGDLLMSNGDGTAVIQDDDIIRSSTIAKAVKSVTGVDGVENVELVPCQLLNG